jgi:hypothetical protein
MKRQEYWKDKGYSQDQINIHLNFEKRKSKESRERRIKNNLKNKDLISCIKQDLLNKTFDIGKLNVKVISISPSVDGIGFWFKAIKNFSDGSSGVFREFYDFNGYTKEEFVKWLGY